MQPRRKQSSGSRCLAIGINMGDAEYASKVSDKCRRACLLVTSKGEALTMFSALDIDQKDAREGLDILEQRSLMSLGGGRFYVPIKTCDGDFAPS